MARTCLFDASAGEITCGTVDGINLLALHNYAMDHDHGITGNTGSVSAYHAMRDSAGGTSFRTSNAGDPGGGAGEAGAAAHAYDTHFHGKNTLATNVCFPSAGAVGPSDDEIIVTAASGDVVADLLSTVAPDYSYSRFNLHYHSMMGNTENKWLAALRPYRVGAATYKYFNTATDSIGTGAYWEELTTNGGSHFHAYGGLGLAAYAAPGGGGAGDAGAPKFAIRAATGNLETKLDCNGIDVSKYYTTFSTHILHAVTGATANFAQSDANLRGVSTGHTYIKVSATLWRTAYVRRIAHSHSGAGLVVGVRL